MKKLLLLITALFILASVEGQILRYSNYTAPKKDTLTYAGVIGDDNTFGWYIADADNITLNGSEVDYWNDISGNANHLYRAGSDQRPDWDAVNGEIDFTTIDELRKTSVVQSSPLTIYAVLRIDTPVAYSDLIVLAVDSYYIRLRVPSLTSAMSMTANTGYFETNTGFFSTGTYYILRIVVNDAVSNGSKIQLNENAAATGTLAAVTTDRIRIGGGAGTESTVSYKEIIVRANLDDADEQQLIVDYLNDKYSVYE